MKKNKSSTTSLLTKYSQLYEKNPKSRVFAPLAESYRKIGMLDKSFEILRKGIQQHPSYTLGYIVLAHCYFDKEKFELSYNTLRPLVAANLENLSLQKIFAQTCVKLGFLEEALNSYKNLLLVNPRDQYIAEQVKLLEDDLLVSEDEPIITHPHRRLEDSVFADDEDDWVQVDFNQSHQERRKNPLGEEWSLLTPTTDNPLDKFKSDLKDKKFDVEEHELDDDYFLENYDNPAEDVIEPDVDEISEESADKPIITHTLVDLYCRQGHYQQAIDILSSILKLHPKDKATINKLNELQRYLDSEEIVSEVTVSEEIEYEEIESEELSESDGHNELLSLIDETKKKESLNQVHDLNDANDDHKSKQLEQVKGKLMAFLDEIKMTAQTINGKA